jgi:predicted glycosyltransferase
MSSSIVQTQPADGNALEVIRAARPSTGKKIWIDLDNSPHVPFFLPIIEGLEREGYQVFLTARDSYQVCELLRLHRISCRVIGRHYGKNRVLKLFGTALRALQLLPLALKERPILALSHTSRAQFLTAWLLRIPNAIMFDYEFVNATGFLRPDWVFVPDMIPSENLAQEPDRVFRYHGLKEDVYVPRFKPDSDVKSLLGVRENELMVTVRPPATEAHYHNSESEQLFEASIEFLLEQPNLRVVLLPRNHTQGDLIRSQWKPAIDERRIIVPAQAVDGLNLIWDSDLVISGGGTMNREAAALGVPVYSIFRGRIGAVDQYLAKTGRLTLIETVQEIRTKIVLKRRIATPRVMEKQSTTLSGILEAIVSIVEHKCLPVRR